MLRNQNSQMAEMRKQIKQLQSSLSLHVERSKSDMIQKENEIQKLEKENLGLKETLQRRTERIKGLQSAQSKFQLENNELKKELQEKKNQVAELLANRAKQADMVAQVCTLVLFFAKAHIHS
jgi:chromosome segregation ATPase